VTLTAGERYVLAAGYYGAGLGDKMTGTAEIDPVFTMLQDRYSNANATLAFPELSCKNLETFGYFGPNLSGWVPRETAGASVPVPDGGTTASLLGLGMLAIGWMRRRVR